VLNRIIVIGRLTRDPELRYTSGGIAVATFTVAVDRTFTNQQGQRETDFIPVVVWRKQAEVCANHLNKGRLVAVDGRLQIRSYETAEGQRRTVSEIVADNVRFLDWPQDGGGGGGGGRGGSESSGRGEDEPEFLDDDVPF